MAESNRPPANFWATIIALASLALSALGMLNAANKSDTEETRKLEQRLCRIEALTKIGECKQ